MSEEVKAGNDQAGASASVGTEQTDSSVSAGAGVEAHAGAEANQETRIDGFGDVETGQHAQAEVHIDAGAEAGFDGRNATAEAGVSAGASVEAGADVSTDVGDVTITTGVSAGAKTEAKASSSKRN